MSADGALTALANAPFKVVTKYLHACFAPAELADQAVFVQEVAVDNRYDVIYVRRTNFTAVQVDDLCDGELRLFENVLKPLIVRDAGLRENRVDRTNGNNRIARALVRVVKRVPTDLKPYERVNQNAVLGLVVGRFGQHTVHFVLD